MIDSTTTAELDSLLVRLSSLPATAHDHTSHTPAVPAWHAAGLARSPRRTPTLTRIAHDAARCLRGTQPGLPAVLSYAPAARLASGQPAHSQPA